MPKIDILTIAGKKSDSLSLPKEIFGAKINKPLMAQAVRVYLANQRRAYAKTKTRGEVRGSGRKIWRQKGTGRARHGDRYAPIFVGGGVAHGPTGKQNYQLKMSKKMKKRALFSALTSQLKAGQIVAVKGLEKIEPKTKKMVKILDQVVGRGKKRRLKTAMVLPGVLVNVLRAGHNIDGLNLIQANSLNPYQILNAKKIVFLPESVEKLKEVYLKK